MTAHSKATLHLCDIAYQNCNILQSVIYKANGMILSVLKGDLNIFTDIYAYIYTLKLVKYHWIVSSLEMMTDFKRIF